MGAATGRIDAVAFMLGTIAGVWAFAEAWVGLERFVTSGALESGTLAELLGVPFWTVAAALVAMAIGVALLLRRIEAARRPGGSA